MSDMARKKASDEELMIAYQKGDINSFSILFDRYQDKIYRYFYFKFSDSQLASDFYQETFLRVHRARDQFDSNKKFSSWIFSIASNLRKDELRRLSRRPSDGGYYEELEDIADEKALTAESNLDKKLLKKQLDLALETLKQDQREIIVLHKYENMSFAEIAEALNMKREAVKSKAFRGYKVLREYFKNHSGGKDEL